MNEAFAPQYLAVEKSLNLDPSKTNVNGGAIALGHPLAGSGSRITAHLVHELRYVLEIVGFQICCPLCKCMNVGFPRTVQHLPILPHSPLPCFSPWFAHAFFTDLTDDSVGLLVSTLVTRAPPRMGSVATWHAFTGGPAFVWPTPGAGAQQGAHNEALLSGHLHSSARYRSKTQLFQKTKCWSRCCPLRNLSKLTIGV